MSYTQNIKALIIGGAPVSNALLESIKNHSSRFYETYGMTETLTHVAIKPLMSKVLKGEDYFTALSNIVFHKDERDCLNIVASKLVREKVITNDVIDLVSETTFKWLGRYDSVINSGGVKLFPELIERKLESVIKERFIIASKPDTDLGEKLILIIENPADSIASIQRRINALMTLKKLEIPQLIYILDTFTETENSKIQRVKTISRALA